jgi:hypothetical protein
MRKPHDKQHDEIMSKRDEDLLTVVRVTHPVRKLDSSWSSEEEEIKEESANDSEEESEAGTKETQEGLDQTGDFLMYNRDPTPIMPKDPLSILKVSKPSMFQVAQSGMVEGVNPAFGSLCQAGGTRRISPRQNMQTFGILN